LDSTAIQTIDLLEARLRRIEYVLHGQRETAYPDGSKSAIQRLRDLEHVLGQLIAKSKVVQDLLKLHARHPDFFHPMNTQDVPSSLDTPSKASIVLAAASSYPMTASSLTSILDTPMPTADSSTQLILTQSRVAELDMLQESQMRDIASLKERSAAVLERWYSVDVLRIGECWADIESRVEQAEQAIRQAAIVQRNDEGII